MLDYKGVEDQLVVTHIIENRQSGKYLALSMHSWFCWGDSKDEKINVSYVFEINNIMAKNEPQVKKIKYYNLDFLGLRQKNHGGDHSGAGDDHAAS